MNNSRHKINPSNVMLSVRSPALSFIPRELILLQRQPSLVDQCAMVPSELEETTQLVTDPTLEPNEPGALYLSEDAYYNAAVTPRYALTVHPSLYCAVLGEWNDAYTVPCGLYFCCHGGDGAHTGVSHDDYVDIRIAWALATGFLTVLYCLG